MRMSGPADTLAPPSAAVKLLGTTMTSALAGTGQAMRAVRATKRNQTRRLITGETSAGSVKGTGGGEHNPARAAGESVASKVLHLQHVGSMDPTAEHSGQRPPQQR